MKIPENFTRIAVKKIMMQLDQGYVVTSATDDEVILKRQDDEYGDSRDSYQKVNPYGRFLNCRQSADLLDAIGASGVEYTIKLDSCHFPEDAHRALMDHVKRIDNLMAEFRKAVPNYGGM